MINASGVTKRFEDFVALNNVSCSIPDGRIYGLVGSNGAGKSTFLRALAGIYKPDSGEITYDGEPVWDNASVKERFVFVPDELYFLPGSNMKQMAKFYRTYYPTFSMERFEELVKALNLNPKKRLSGFSKGMKRQAATVLALSCRPQYYFFDETFDGLDPVMREVVKKMIYDDICERNVTAVITSHSLRELENTCDQLVLLHKGGVVFDYDIDNVKSSLAKVQIAVKESISRAEIVEKLALSISSFKQEGKVITLTCNLGERKAEEIFAPLEPLYLEVLPLSLEEMFIQEMATRGYSFLESEEE